MASSLGSVFQPIGFDSFGIQTEAYALRLGENPDVVTRRNIPNFRRQLESIGVAWNWDAVLTTSDPAYYRWTQWIFVKLYRAGLAVQRDADVLWCPNCQTVLAFEQVEGERCERCESVVTHRRTKEWYLESRRMQMSCSIVLMIWTGPRFQSVFSVSG